MIRSLALTRGSLAASASARAVTCRSLFHTARSNPLPTRARAFCAGAPPRGERLGTGWARGVISGALLCAPIICVELLGADDRPPSKTPPASPGAAPRYNATEAGAILRRRLEPLRATSRKLGWRPTPVQLGTDDDGTISLHFTAPAHCDAVGVLGALLVPLEKEKERAQPGVSGGIQFYGADSKRGAERSLSLVFSDPRTGEQGSILVRCRPSPRNEFNGKALTVSLYKDGSLTDAELDAFEQAYAVAWTEAVPPQAGPGHMAWVQKGAGLGRPQHGQRSGANGGGSGDAHAAAIAKLESLGVEVHGVAGTESRSSDGDIDTDSNGHGGNETRGGGATRRPPLNWDSLAGYEDVKRAVEDTVVLALRHPEQYEGIARRTRERFETNRPRAVLFEGPPGTGKTLTARIIAERGAVPMVHVPVQSIMSKWFGESENKLAQVFDACEELGGAIVFIDEVDALAGSRDGGSGGGGGGGAGMHEASRRVLSVLLTKVEDSFDGPRKTTLICATNRRQDLDAAMLSRFNLSIRFDLPDEATRKMVFARYARQLQVTELVNLARESEGSSNREIKEVCEDAERRWASALLRKKVTGDTPPYDYYASSLAQRRSVEGGGNGRSDRSGAGIAV